MEFSSQRSKKRNNSKQFWLAYLKIATELKNWKEVARVKYLINAIVQEDLYGYVVRSRFQGNLTEEHASLFHANKEKNNGKSNNLHSLKINGSTCHDQKVIEHEVVTHFKALFNRYHDRDMHNTGQSFEPEDTHLDFFLGRLSSLDSLDQ